MIGAEILEASVGRYFFERRDVSINTRILDRRSTDLAPGPVSTLAVDVRPSDGRGPMV